MKLRKYVIPTASLVLSSILLGTGVQVYENLVDKEEVIVPVVEPKEVTKTVMEVETPSLGSLFTSDTVSSLIGYYDKEGTKESQESSLIYYESYYMPNTGILYGSDESFEVYSIYDGTVKDIKEDSLMGEVVEVQYSNNLTCLYAGLEDVKVTIGSSVIKGELIGTSKLNTITTDKRYMFHIEVNYKGDTINPESLYTMDINELLSND